MKILAAIGVIVLIWVAGLLAFADRVERSTPRRIRRPRTAWWR